MEVNPYAPPVADLSVQSPESEAQRLRKEHLSTEGSIKSVGALLTLGALVTISTGASQVGSFVDFVGVAVPGTALAIVGVIQLIIGICMVLLQPWTRIPGIVFCAIGLFRFPVGTLFCALFIYYLANRRGSFVLSPAYRAIVEATPQVKRKTSLVMILLLLILLVVLGLVVYWGIATSGV